MDTRLGLEMRARFFFLFLLGLSLCLSSAFAQNGNSSVVRFQTEVGNIDVLLLPTFAPNTVANFLRYVNRGDYNGSFIHRSAPNFVIQGGGYKYVNNQVQTIPTDPPVANEFHVSNTRGTLAAARVAGDLNSATSQWFFNELDSNAGPPNNLDTQDGGQTVFGRIIGSGLAVLDALAAVPIYNFGSPFNQLPLRNYTSGPVADANLVHVISLTVFQTTLAPTRPSPGTIHLGGNATPGAAYNLETSAIPTSGFTFAKMVTADASGNISSDDLSPGTRKFYRLVLP